MTCETIHCRRIPNIILLGLITAAVGLSGCVEMRAPAPLVRYVAFGDSTTVGPTTRDYPDILRELLGEPPETFANEGNGGETTKNGLDRISELLETEQFQSAEVWLYWEGGNDIIEFIQDRDPFLLFSPDSQDYPFADALARQLTEIQANVESAISTLRGAGLEVYVATYFSVRESLAECPPLPLDILLPLQAEHANAYMVRLNESIRLAVSAQGAFLVDVALKDKELRSDAANYFDCNHLSVQGNEIVAGVFADVITDRRIP